MIYLDNCATTKIRNEVLDKMIQSYKEDLGNPSSLHRLGMRSEEKIEESRKNIASYLEVKDSEIFFTSGGTESNNMALRGIVDKMKNRGKHIITSKIEHSSILNVMKDLEKLGYDVSYLSVDESGYIDLDEFKSELREDTILVSLIHVNNELGTIQPIDGVRKILDEGKSMALLHIDGVQSFGKIRFSLRGLKADTYSFSGHKIHGPKGVGGIYIKEKSNLRPLIFGGNQEKGIRSGTENVQGIIGIGEAIRILDENFEKESNHIKEIQNYTIQCIEENIDDIRINTPLEKNVSPNILNISFRNTRGEVLLHYLEDEKIYVSTSSACNANGTSKSHVLESIGLSDNEIEGTLRICFAYDITKEDIDFMVKILKKSVEEIRSIMIR